MKSFSNIVLKVTLSFFNDRRCSTLIEMFELPVNRGSVLTKLGSKQFAPDCRPVSTFVLIHVTTKGGSVNDVWKVITTLHVTLKPVVIHKLLAILLPDLLTLCEGTQPSMIIFLYFQDYICLFDEASIDLS